MHQQTTLGSPRDLAVALRVATTTGRVVTRWRHVGLPLAIFLGAQLLAAVWMLVFASRTHSSYTDFVSRWDGAYYLDIARHGYTVDILRGDQLVDRNWAFYPLYPLTVGALAQVTTLDPSTVAPLLSLTCGAAAVVALHVAVARRLGRRAALTTTLLVSTAMAAPVFQMAYAEGLTLLILVLGLEALSRRRYGWLVVLAPLLALARPVGLPFAALVVVHLVSTGAFQTDRLRGAALAAWTVGATALWPVVAGVVTGVPDVYLRTMALWEVPGVGRSWFAQCAGRPVGWVLIVAALTLPLWLAVRFLPARVPLEWRAWMVVYPAYLLFTSYPSSSTVRYLLLAFPFALVFARPGVARWAPWVVAKIGLVLNFLWVSYFVASWSEIFP